jgi:hypothetical protein
MPTIWDDSARQEILERFARITPAARPGWGKMNAIEMVRHCTLALDMMVGAAAVTPRNGLLRNPLLRYLIIHVLPWPNGAPTGRELITTGYKGKWESDTAALRRSLEAVASRGVNGKFEEHPAFGQLSGKSLGVLVWRHLDHHLRQFGIAK